MGERNIFVSENYNKILLRINIQDLQLLKINLQSK